MLRNVAILAALTVAASAALAQTTTQATSGPASQPTTGRTIWDTPPTATAPVPVPETVTRVVTRTPATALENAKLQLKSTDEEWKVIAPKLRKVMSARREAEIALVTTEDFFGGGFWGRGRQPGFRGPTGDTFAGPGGAGARPRPMAPDTSPTPPATTTSAPATAPASTPKPPDPIQPPPAAPGPPPDGAFMGGGGIVSLALADLRITLADPKSTPEVVAEKVAALRAARKKAREDFTAARDDLLLVVTPEQEIVLISLGYLE